MGRNRGETEGDRDASEHDSTASGHGRRTFLRLAGVAAASPALAATARGATGYGAGGYGAGGYGGSDADAAPTVERFEASERWSPNPHATFTVDWSVRDADGDLAGVAVTVSRGDAVVAQSQASASGASASGSERLRVKRGGGAEYLVTLEVTDAAGHATTSSRYVLAP